MTKAEIKTFGDALDDTAPIINYGKTSVCFDLHPEQVQPSHIVITSAHFRTDERTFGLGHTDYIRLTLEQKDRIRKLYRSGLSTKRIGEIYGMRRQSCYRILMEV